MRVHIIGNINPLNNGSLVLFLSVTRFLSNLFPGIELTKESLLPHIDGRLNHTCKCTKSMKSSITLLCSTLIRAILWRIFWELGINVTAIFNEPLKQYYEADVIMDLSGDGLCPPQSRGYWYSLSKVLFKLANLISIAIALILKKKVFLYSISIGNLSLLAPLAKVILNNVALIAAREYASLEYLRKIGVAKPVIYFAPDAAFSIKLPKKAFKNRDAPVFGFILSTEAVQHLHGFKIQHFVRIMCSLIDYLSENLGAEILLIPFSLGGPFRHDDDRILLGELLKNIVRKNVSMICGNSLSSIIDAISECDILVTMRMHPVIISLLYGIPTLVLSHSPKFHGLIKLIGLKDLLCDLTQINYESLKEKFLYVWENRCEIRSNIERKIDFLTSLSLKGLEKMALMLREVIKA